MSCAHRKRSFVDKTGGGFDTSRKARAGKALKKEARMRRMRLENVTQNSVLLDKKWKG